ncbi:MAG: hypothetical protein FWC50_04200 [Planctomycetaceae bacterium]|nr:hypothetical protein [Planctomycetaceae bacterium]
MTDNHNGKFKFLIRGTEIALFNFFVTAVLGLIVPPMVGKYLGADDFATWVTAGNLVLWYALLDMGMIAGVSRFFTKAISGGRDDECLVHANTSLVMLSGISMIVIPVSWVLAWILPFFFNNVGNLVTFRIVIVISGLNMAITFPMKGLTGLIIGAMRTDLLGMFNLVSKIVISGLTVIILLTNGGVIALAVMMLLVSLLQVAILVMILRKVYPQIRFSLTLFRKSHLRTLFHFSFFAMLAQFGYMGINSIWQFVIPTFIEFRLVSHFWYANTLNENFMNITLATSNWFDTWLTHLHTIGEREQMRKFMLVGYKFCIYSGVFIYFGFLFFAKAFITRWVEPQFHDAFVPTLFLGGVSLIYAIQTPNIRLFYATAKHQAYAFSNIAEGVLNLILSITLGIRYGINGVAAASLISCFFPKMVFVPYCACRLLNWNLLYYYGTIFTIVLRAVVALIPSMWLASRFVQPNYFSIFGMAFVCLLAYLPCLAVVGLSADERGYFWSNIKRFLRLETGGRRPEA